MHLDSDGVLSPPDNPESFTEFAPELSDVAQFDFEILMNKDSTNMFPSDWTKIATKIYQLRNEGYRGFVVAHGTDTMHFSASAVALALGKNLNFPVVFTGAQTTPDVHHGDARVNLLRAFKVADTELAEVVICFGNYVFRGCRAQKKDERRFDAFESPSFFPLADITADILVNPSARKRNELSGEDIDFKPDFASGIFQVSLIPGLEPGLLFDLLNKEDCKGIVLQSFGAGNVPNEAPYSLTGFIEQAKAKGKPVLVTSQFPANATLHTKYAPGREAIEAGAIPTGNMTSACAMAKFRWVLAQVDERHLTNEERLNEISRMMNYSYIGELDVENVDADV
jgi:L-asparaginase type I